MSDFVDRVTVHVKGGDGGNGSAGIRREKYKNKTGVARRKGHRQPLTAVKITAIA